MISPVQNDQTQGPSMAMLQPLQGRVLQLFPGGKDIRSKDKFYCETAKACICRHPRPTRHDWWSFVGYTLARQWGLRA